MYEKPPRVQGNARVPTRRDPFVCTLARFGPKAGEEGMGMRAGDRGEAYGPGHEASGVAWSSPKKLFGILDATVLLLGLAIGVWGDTTSSAQTNDQPTRAASASECKTIGGKISYRNTRGQLLAYFYMSQKSCWNYSQIT